MTLQLPPRALPAGAAGQSVESILDTYRRLRLPPERLLRMMVARGFSPETLRPHFPEFPDEAFVRSVPGQVSIPAAPSKAVAAKTSTGRHSVRLEEGISFQYVPLIQCSFPHADPKHETSFTRRNGWLELTLATTRPSTGLPYGVPARLLTIYCTSEAVRTHSPEIALGKSVHDFLRRLDVPISRGPRGSLALYADQMQRLVHATLSIDENVTDGAGRTGLHIRQALLVEEAQLWWDDPHGRSGLSAGSSLTLSTVFFQSILERSAPLSTGALKRLRRSPMDLDVYAWLVHRLAHLHKPSNVTWQQLAGQFGHGYSELRKFRQFFLGSLKRVSEVYQEAKFRPDDGGVLLLPSKPHVPRLKTKALLAP